jgi:hypothetical protein
MAKTIAQGWQEFHTRLTPTSTEEKGASGHRETVESCLRDNLGMYRFARIGSFGNGTSITGYSDTDYIAVCPSDKLPDNSANALVKVKGVLDDRFVFTEVKVRTPAVRLEFGTTAAQKTEIVPAYYKGTHNGYDVYGIADGDGKWMNASPDAHNEYVREVNDKHSGKVKKLIRYIKAWKYFRDVPISSFYLEMRTAKYADGESSIVYSIDVQRVLKQMLDGGLARMQDPTGIGGYITPCSTQAKHDDAIGKLETAVARAEKACNAENAGNIADAFDWWNKLYYYEFPKY